MTQHNPDALRIQISETMVQKLGWMLLGIAVLLTIVGGFVSPIDDQGKPVLLLPDVKAVEDYRRSAQGWINEMTVLDGEISQLIASEQQGDFFLLSRAAQETLQHAVDLAQKVDRTKIPPIGMGLHEQVLSTVVCYLEAARCALRWVSTPDQENLNLAVEVLGEAQMMKSELETNQWLTTR